MRNRLLLLVVAAMFGCLSLSQAALIGHWPLDELSGTTAVDSANGNNGVNSGGGLTWQTGVVGGAAALDGASTVGHDLMVSSIPQMSGATALSISCWINASYSTTYKGVVMTRDVTDSNGTGRNWGVAREYSDHIDGRVTGASIDSSSDSAPDGEWLHIVLVWDGSAKTRRIYINGVADPASAVSTTSPSSITTSGVWYFGTDISSVSRHFSGAIDDVAMWNSALSASDVATIYQGGLDGLDAPSALAGDPAPVNQDYYVATNGVNTAAGTIGAPFRDIAKAVQMARPGDTVYVRAGTYREKIIAGRSGEEGNPITFKAYSGETVVVTTTDEVSSWTLQSGDVNGDGSSDSDVWAANVAWDAGTDGVGNTLFVDGTLKFEAREGAEDDPMRLSNWGRIESGDLSLTGFTADDLRYWGDDFWNGAKVRHHVTDWTIVESEIADYSSSDGTVTFATALSSTSQKHNIGYHIYGTIKTLNEAGEWFKDTSTDTLYYKASSGQDPNSLTMEFKNRDYCFDVSGSDYINIEDFVLRGGTILNSSSTDHNIWSGNTIYAYDKGSYGRAYLSGSYNIFRDNEVGQSWGSVLSISGTRQQMINNYLHDIGYNGTTKAITMGGSEHLVSYNTVSKFARSFLDGFPLRSEFSYNVFEDGGNLSWDTGVFDGDAGRGNGGGSIVHHNVIRHHDGTGIYMGFYSGVDLTFHHNIIYDTEPSTTMRVGFLTCLNYYHNTFIGEEPWSNYTGSPVNSSYRNNIQLSIDKVGELGMTFRGNHDYSTSDFEDFAGEDFRLAAGAGAIDRGVVLAGINDGYDGSAPDAGALEYGEAMFAVGHNFTTPPNPVYNWFVVPGANLEQNGQFNTTPEEWAFSGDAARIFANTWNGSGLGRQGNYNILLGPGDGFSRTFTDLEPNTWYALGTEIRLIDVVAEAEDFDASSPASVNEDSWRSETYIDGLTTDDWVSYDAIDFGSSGRYDQMEMQYSFPSGGALGTDTATVEVRLDSSTGTILGTFSFNLLAEETWYVTQIDIPDTTGSQTVCLVTSGTGVDRLRIGNIRLLSSNVPPERQVKVTVSGQGDSDVISYMGEAYWKGQYEMLSFKTGSSATSANIAFLNTGAYGAYLDSFLMFEDEAPEDGTATGFSLQSSTYYGNLSSKAINSSTSDAAITLSEAGSWWQVDLGQVCDIEGIYLRPPASTPGTLSDFNVSLWATDPRDGGSPVWEKDYVASASPGNGDVLVVKELDYALDGVTTLQESPARYVKVELNGTGRLGLADVIVDVVEGDDLAESDAEVSTGSSYWEGVFPQTINLGQIKLQNVADDDYLELSNFRISVWDYAPSAGGTIVWQQTYLTSGSVGRCGTFVVAGDETATDGDTRLASVYGRCVRIDNMGTNAAGNTNLSLEDVTLKDADTVRPGSNIALLGTASQISDLYSNQGTADVANNSVVFPLGDFSSTAYETDPWWEVQLEEVSDIDQIVLFNRIDAAERMGSFRVSVLNDSRSEIWGQNYYYATDLPSGGTLTINDNISNARYVRVQIDGYTILSLPEVQVWSTVSPTLRLDPATTVHNFDPGTLTSTLMSGWTRLSPETGGDVWWDGDVSAVDRGTSTGANNINRDLVYGDSATTLNLRLTNGVWEVKFNMGDVAAERDNMQVWCEGSLRTSGDGLGSTNAVPYLVFDAELRDGELNIQFDDNGGADPNWSFTRLTLTRTGDLPANETVSVDTTRTDFNYDLGPVDSIVMSGWTRLTPSMTGDIAWSATANAVDRGAGANDINRDLIYGSAATTLEHAISNGSWNVVLNMGDSDAAHDDMVVKAEGITQQTDVDSAAGSFPYANFEVDVTDGSLSIEFSDAGGSDSDWVVTRMSLTRNADTPAPSALLASETGSYSIDLSWIDNSENETGFGIQRKTGSGGTWATIHTTAAAVTSYSDSELTHDTTYFYRVFAVGAYFDSDFTAESSATTDADPGNMSVDTTLTNYRYDFGTQTSPVMSGWMAITPSTFNDISWSSSVSAVDRGSAVSDLLRDLVYANSAVTLEHAISNGTWNVELTMGDNSYAHDLMEVTGDAGIALYPANASAAAAEFLSVSGLVIVTDSSLSITFDDLGGSDASWVLNSMELERISDLTSFVDSDADGLPDVYEELLYGDPTANTDGTDDLDGDGLTDAHEYTYYGHPAAVAAASADLDGDTYSDLIEMAVGTDFDDPSDTPALSSASLIGHWPLDESSGEIAYDASGMGHDAIWAGSIGENAWVTGLIGGAAQLNDEDGGSENEHFQIPDVDSLNYAGSFSLSLWFNQNVANNNNATYNGLFMTRDMLTTFGGGSENWGFALENNSTPRHIDWRYDGASMPEVNNIVGDVVDEWQHVLYVWDGFSGTGSLYQNGAPINSVAVPTGSIISGGLWLIGNDSCCGGREFTGTFDDIAMFRTALTAADVSKIYNGGLSGYGIESLMLQPTADVDSDADGLSDTFELTYYGHKTTATDGTGDVDGDGYSDKREVDTLTNAADPTSFFDLVSGGIQIGTDDSVTLSWYSEIGQEYSIWSATTLAPSNWALYDTVTATTNVTDFVESFPGTGSTFLRVEVNQP